MLLPKLENEQNLLQRIAQNDEQALAAIFFAYHHDLGSFVNTLLQDRESTLEVVQDVFLKLWLSREHLPEVTNFTGYLFILTRNYTLNKIRQLNKERVKHQQYVQSVENDYADTTSFDVQQEARHRLLDRAINLLPPQQRKVFMLRQQGLKNPEIAQLLHISITSVAKYQQLAMQALTEYVRAYSLIVPLFFLLF